MCTSTSHTMFTLFPLAHRAMEIKAKVSISIPPSHFTVSTLVTSRDWVSRTELRTLLDARDNAESVFTSLLAGRDCVNAKLLFFFWFVDASSLKLFVLNE